MYMHWSDDLMKNRPLLGIHVLMFMYGLIIFRIRSDFIIMIPLFSLFFCDFILNVFAQAAKSWPIYEIRQTLVNQFVTNTRGSEPPNPPTTVCVSKSGPQCHVLWCFRKACLQLRPCKSWLMRKQLINESRYELWVFFSGQRIVIQMHKNAS